MHFRLAHRLPKNARMTTPLLPGDPASRVLAHKLSPEVHACALLRLTMVDIAAKHCSTSTFTAIDVFTLRFAMKVAEADRESKPRRRALYYRRIRALCARGDVLLHVLRTETNMAEAKMDELDLALATVSARVFREIGPDIEHGDELWARATGPVEPSTCETGSSAMPNPSSTDEAQVVAANVTAAEAVDESLVQVADGPDTTTEVVVSAGVEERRTDDHNGHGRRPNGHPKPRPRPPTKPPSKH